MNASNTDTTPTATTSHGLATIRQDAFFNYARLMRVRFFVLVPIFFLLAGCMPRATFRLANETEKPARSVVVFFVDGLDKARLNEAVQRNLVPNINRYFIEGGVGVEHAMTSIPAITYPNAVSLLTGCFPGHHGVVGNQWFDRETLLLRGYGSASTYRCVNDDFAQPTLFEILDDQFTVCVQTHTDRGADEVVDHWVTSGFDWALGDYSSVDARVGDSVGEVLRMADRDGRWPSVYFNYFPGLDEVGHRKGPDSADYLEAMRTVDTAMGEIITAMQQARPAKQVYYVLVTDHNHLPASPERSLDLAKWLRWEGYRVHTGPLQSKREADRLAHLNRFDAVVIEGAYRRGVIFLRGGEWHHRPSQRQIGFFLRRIGAKGAQAMERSPRSCAQGSDWVGRVAGVARAEDSMGFGEDAARRCGLLSHPAVALACWRVSDNVVEVRSRQGAAIIERRGPLGSREYRLRFSMAAPWPIQSLPDSGDPLGYMRSSSLRAFVREGWHTSRAWLTATAGDRYPDFVPQIVEFFDSPRAGDVVLFAARGWSFDGAWRGGHGSCMADDMDVPLYFAGPGLPEGGTIGCARTVDVLPTVLDFLGEGDRLDRVKLIDGVSLLPSLRAALRTAQP